MMKKYILVILLLISPSFAQQSSQPERAPLDPTSKILTYIPSRIIDFIDIFELQIIFGPSIGLELSLNEFKIGALAGYPLFGLHLHRGNISSVALKEGSSYFATAIFGKEESRLLKDPSNIAIAYYSDYDISGTLGLGLGSIKLGLDFSEVVDFFAGFVFIDPLNDDYYPPYTTISDDSGIAGNRPVDKLARGLYNVFMGWWDWPLTVADINDNEGGVKALFYGVPTGFGRAVTRTGVGFFELATFWLGGDPIILPEYSFNIEDFPFSLGNTDWDFNL